MADKEISELTAATTPLSGSEEIHIDQGGNSRRVALSDVAAISTGAMLKSEYDPNADSIISVANGGTNAATAAGARTNLGLGTMAVQNAATVAITGGSVTGITDLAVADGGSGASDAAGARTNFGLVIGTDVMAYSANLAGFAATTVTNVQNRVNHTGTQLAATISDFSTAADLRVTAAIGSTVQAWSANLDSWSAIATATKLDASVIPAASDGKILSWTGTSLVNKTAGELGVFVIGTDVQAWSANLDAWSALATSAKQDADANLDVVAADGVTDALLATPSLLRNRNLDQVFLSDFFTTAAAQNDFRTGANPDITQELNDMDAALADGGTAYIPPYNGIISGTVTKQPSTHWKALKSTIFGTWSCQFNGNIIEIIGTNASRDGGLDGLRLIGNKTTYPLSKAIYAEKIFTHRYENLRIGGFNYGIEEKSTVATQGRNLYIFDCLTTGHYVWSDPLDGDPDTHSSDHRFYDCQWTGDQYGFQAVESHSIKMTAARPQASGVANLRLEDCDDFQFNGGFIDSARYFNNFAGGGDGASLTNCDRPNFVGVGFFDNGISSDATKSHLRFFADEPMRGVGVVGCYFKDFSGIPMQGITFNSPSGTGAYRYGRIIGNDFSECATPISGHANLGRDWRIDHNINFSQIQFVVDNAATAVTVFPYVTVVRITGQNVARDIVMPGPGHFPGKVVEVWFESGSGTITIRRPDGTTSITTMTSGTRKSFICTAANDTVTSAVFA